MVWGSVAVAATGFVGYQAGSLKSQFLAQRNYRDPETGLLTRKGFEHQALRMLRKEVGPMVVMMDLNKLKEVNDTHGHLAGDFFIRDMAGRLREWTQVRGGTVARLGGDEFVAITKGSADIMRLREDLKRPVLWEGETHQWSASTGAATVMVGIHHDARKKVLSAAMHEADLRMYEEKGEGRSRR